MHAYLLPMSDEDLSEWIASIKTDYIGSRITAGESAEEAKAAADKASRSSSPRVANEIIMWCSPLLPPTMNVPIYGLVRKPRPMPANGGFVM